MYIDNVQFLCFKASIDNVKNVLDRINSIKSDAEIIQLLMQISLFLKNILSMGFTKLFLRLRGMKT